MAGIFKRAFPGKKFKDETVKEWFREYSEKGFAVFAYEGEKIIGCGAGIRLKSDWNEFMRVFESLEKLGKQPKNCFLLLAFAVTPEYQDKGVGSKLFKVKLGFNSSRIDTFSCSSRRK